MDLEKCLEVLGEYNFQVFTLRSSRARLKKIPNNSDYVVELFITNSDKDITASLDILVSKSEKIAHSDLEFSEVVYSKCKTAKSLIIDSPGVFSYFLLEGSCLTIDLDYISEQLFKNRLEYLTNRKKIKEFNDTIEKVKKIFNEDSAKIELTKNNILIKVINCSTVNDKLLLYQFINVDTRVSYNCYINRFDNNILIKTDINSPMELCKEEDLLSRILQLGEY